MSQRSQPSLTCRGCLCETRPKVTLPFLLVWHPSWEWNLEIWESQGMSVTSSDMGKMKGQKDGDADLDWVGRGPGEGPAHRIPGQPGPGLHGLTLPCSQTVHKQERAEASCSLGSCTETGHRLSSQHLSGTPGFTCLVCAL